MLLKSDFDAFLMEYFTPKLKEKTRFDDHPFLAMVPKDAQAEGEYVVSAIDLHDGAEGSSQFAIAQAIARGQAPGKVQFRHDWTLAFDLAQISNAAIRASRSEKHALQKAADEYERCEARLSNKLARALFRSGFGEKGVLGSTTNTATAIIILADPTDSRFFSINDQLQFSSALATATLRGGGAYVSVTKIDHDSGTITTDAPVSLAASIAGITAGDFIFANGDRQDSATPTRIQIPGLQAWIPDAAPSATLFGGVDRTVWVNRLAGLRYPAVGNASGPVQETFIRALAHAGNYRAKISHVFCAPNVYANLLIALEGQRGIRDINEKVGNIGFSGFEITTGYTPKPVKVFVDGDCPPSRAYGLKLDVWKLLSLGDLIQDDMVGSKGGARDVEDASAVEYRRVFHGGVMCQDPGQNIVIKFA